MAYSIIQQLAPLVGENVSTLDAAFGVGQSAGELLVLLIDSQEGGNGGVSSITGGGTWVKVDSFETAEPGGTAYQEVWFCKATSGNATAAITWAGACYPVVLRLRVGGSTSPQAGSWAENEGTGATTPDAGNVAPTATDNFVCAIAHVSWGHSITAGSGYSSTFGQGWDRTYFQWKVNGAASSQSTAFGSAASSGGWASVAAVIEEPAAAGGAAGPVAKKFVHLRKMRA